MDKKKLANELYSRFGLGLFDDDGYVIELDLDELVALISKYLEQEK